MNMQGLMAQAQKMQREVTKAKEELDKKIFEGKSEWVKLELNGAKELVNFELLWNEPIDSDDKEVLEDMIKIAFNNALSDVDKETEKTMGKYGNGLGGLF